MTQQLLQPTRLALPTRVYQALLNLVLQVFSYLGSPAVLAFKERELRRLEVEIAELKTERRLLLDSLLAQRGVPALGTPQEPLPEPFQQIAPFDSWQKSDIKREIEELAQLAEAEPDIYGPLLEEALIRYKDELK